MTRTWRRSFVAALFICNAGVATAATDNARPCEREMARASRQHGIPLGILYAVGLTETGRRGALYPYALGAEGQTVFAKDMNDAIANFEAMRAKGIKLIDLGCMQINHYYHGGKFASVRAMFDPAGNVDYAARFLKELKQREGSWTMAVARYNAGPNNQPAQKRYVCHIVAHLVSSGFGAWTDKARSFCQP
ncbi:FIG016425 Soluble lytic murein transglycosylase and related regulatory proteins some contain LysMinvasin domains [Bradyrhizobium sp.]|uniref:transglycosylase SLT domain-containing protein n=1 Tax=Bradyrhizobium sp. TaxID=376 RepID=UPI0007C1A5E4|nr:transglycosylase SLT domain-containing protein [Bradyrhizobium sp.]CUT13734.1 FIG016425 Soluble lytic murein transglycosylase and related regulatory proteins some contain LysMinvasin domains [Bradyrhizobium sp.]